MEKGKETHLLYWGSYPVPMTWQYPGSYMSSHAISHLPGINLIFLLRCWGNWSSDGLRTSHNVILWTARLPCGPQTTSQSLCAHITGKGLCSEWITTSFQSRLPEISGKNTTTCCWSPLDKISVNSLYFSDDKNHCWDNFLCQVNLAFFSCTFFITSLHFPTLSSYFTTF